MNGNINKVNCFLSLPHESDHLRNELKKVVEKVCGKAIFVIESQGQRLRTEIKNGLASSSILIADLSSPPNSSEKNKRIYGPRPAIMWEIGYAEASGMNAIYLCQKSDRKTNIPSLISEEHVVEYESHQLDIAIEKIEKTLEKMITKDNISSPSIFRSNCYLDRKSCDLEIKYLSAKKTLRILELNLETVKTQASMIIKALHRNSQLTVQMLTLDPFSTFAEARADQLAELEFVYRRQLFENMKGLYNELKEIPINRWELRVYDTFPTQIMFQIDDAIFHSIISLGRKSRDMLHFEVQRLQPNAETSFEAHFRTLWNRSTKYEKWIEKNNDKVNSLLNE